MPQILRHPIFVSVSHQRDIEHYNIVAQDPSHDEEVEDLMRAGKLMPLRNRRGVWINVSRSALPDCEAVPLR